MEATGVPKDEPESNASSTSGNATPQNASRSGTPRVGDALPANAAQQTPPAPQPQQQQQQSHSNSVQQQVKYSHQQQQQQQQPQSKYASLLSVIEDMGKDIRPTYAGNKASTEKLKRNIIHARLLVRECLIECDRAARRHDQI